MARSGNLVLDCAAVQLNLRILPLRCVMGWLAMPLGCYLMIQYYRVQTKAVHHMSHDVHALEVRFVILWGIPGKECLSRSGWFSQAGTERDRFSQPGISRQYHNPPFLRVHGVQPPDMFR